MFELGKTYEFGDDYLWPFELTLSLNRMNKARNWRSAYYRMRPFRKIWRRQIEELQLPKIRFPVHIHAIRCHSKGPAADIDNVIGGCKPLIDELVRKGIFKDDSQEYILEYTAESRKRSDWGEYAGPATWLLVRRI